MKKLCKSNFKRVTAYLLALSLIFSLGTANLLTPSALSAAWDGSTAETYAGGSGTQEAPYLVSTAAQLRKAAGETNNKGVYYKLTNDIYLNGDEATDWATFDWDNATGLNQWFGRWGTDVNNQFNGNFDGCGYTVYGLFNDWDKNATAEGSTRMALFPVIGPNAVIKNVNIKGAKLYSNYAAAALVGQVNRETEPDSFPEISGCYADSTVSLISLRYAGGFIAVGHPPIIENCGFTGSVSGVDEANGNKATGGIMGRVWDYGLVTENTNGILNNCYSVGSEITGTNIGQFWRSSGSLENLYSDINDNTAWAVPNKLTVSQMKGAEAIANMAFDRLDWDFFHDGYPVPCVRANGYASGTGIETDPYIIKTEAQLKYLVTDTATSGNYYKLANNIVVNESLEGNPKLWLMTVYSDNDPVGATFNGNLDGDGHTVSGIFYNGSATGNAYWASVGLIPRAGGDATVSNIGLVNSSLTLNGGTAGSIVGLMWHDDGNNQFKVSGCFADETVTLSGTADLGGITGRLVGHGVISDCYFTGSLAAGNNNNATYAGGGWGQTRTVEKFYTTSPISITSDVYYNGVYTTKTAVTSGIAGGGSTTQITLESIKGETAKTTLSGFDFSNTWRLTDSYPVLLKFYQAERQAAGLWDGSAASDYDGGEGTAENPYKVATAEQLRKLVTDAATEGNYYVLTSDIKLNDTAAENWTTSLLSNNWVTRYNGDIQFKGNFNGGGHNISGMLYTASNTTDGHRSGLFPVVGAGAVITNFSVSDSVMSVGCYGGAAAGFIEGMSADATFPKFSYIDIRNTVTIKGATVGGIVGGGTIANFDNCCVTAELVKRDELKDSAYGIAGDLWGIGAGVFYDISNCYTSKYIPYNTAHALVDRTNSYKNVYAVDYGAPNVTPSDVNADALSKLPNLNWKDVWAWDGEGTVPYLKLNESGNYGVYKLGDTDCDGEAAGAADLVVMRKHLLGAKNNDGTAVFAYNADVTEDGTVDIRDLVRLKKIQPVA